MYRLCMPKFPTTVDTATVRTWLRATVASATAKLDDPSFAIRPRHLLPGDTLSLHLAIEDLADVALVYGAEASAALHHAHHNSVESLVTSALKRDGVVAALRQQIAARIAQWRTAGHLGPYDVALVRTEHGYEPRVTPTDPDSVRDADVIEVAATFTV